MSASSTNKQPLLIDRPLMRVRSLEKTTTLGSTVDPGTTSNGALLVDCTKNDGAFIDCIWLIQRVGNDATPVHLYLSSSAVALGTAYTGSQTEAYYLGSATMAASTAAGGTVEFKLPKVLSPVPHAGGAGTGDVPLQFRGLYVENGYALWAAAASATPVANAPLIALQGGFY